MSSEHAHSEGVPAAALVAPGTGSILELATRVLDEHGVGRVFPSEPTPYPMRAPLGSDLIKQICGFRQQAQDLVDALTSALEQRPATVSPPRVMDPGRHTPPAPEPGSTSLVNLLRATAQHGQAATTRLGLINDTSDLAEVVLRATSLVNQRGSEIPSSHVSFAPNPVRVTGAQQQPVYITVRVPEKTPPGTYSGLVQAAELPGVAALLVVDVIPADSTK
jgi:hypothetical protein